MVATTALPAQVLSHCELELEPHRAAQVVTMPELERTYGWPASLPRAVDGSLPLLALSPDEQRLLGEARAAATGAGARSLLGGWLGRDRLSGGFVLVVTWSRRTVDPALRAKALDAVGRAVLHAELDVPVLVVDDSAVPGRFLHELIALSVREDPPPSALGRRDAVAIVAFLAACGLVAVTPMPWLVGAVVVLVGTVLAVFDAAARRGFPVMGFPSEPGEKHSPAAIIILLLILAALYGLRTLLFGSTL